MTQYCRVENSEVIEGPRFLPKTWKNISNFPALTDVEKIIHGWYPTEITNPEFEPIVQVLTGPIFTILADRVQCVWSVEERLLAEVKAELVAKLKAETQTKILAEYPEHEQRNAALGILNVDQRDVLVAAIQAYRSSCETAEANIYASTTALVARNAFDLWYAS